MPLSDLTDPAAVNAAMDEFDRIGRDNFLRKYGFGPSRVYFVRRDGNSYDSKAIVGAAHGYQYPQMGRLRADDFSGGETPFAPSSRRLGFPSRCVDQTSLRRLPAMISNSFVKADLGIGTRTFRTESEQPISAYMKRFADSPR
jgi:hypothetical protein